MSTLAQEARRIARASTAADRSVPGFHSWRGIIERCFYKDNPAYENYGGRGITLHPEWMIFRNFIADVGEPPARGYTIDRIDNSLSYVPGNIRWATSTQQNRNRRDNRIIAAFGRAQCAAAWADELGINVGTIYARLRRGWGEEKTLATKPRARRDYLNARSNGR